MKGNEVFDYYTFYWESGAIREKSCILASFLYSKATHLYLKLNGQVLLAEVKVNLMSFACLVKQTNKDCLLDFSIWQQMPQMTKRTRLRLCISLHALCVVLFVAVVAVEKLFFAWFDQRDMFATETHILVTEIGNEAGLNYCITVDGSAICC